MSMFSSWAVAACPGESAAPDREPPPVNKRMTSHARKNPGSKGPKAQPTNPKAKTKRLPTRRKTPRSTPSVFLLGLGGLALIANGVAVTIGPRYLPELAEWARMVARVDVSGPMQCLVGAVLFGLAIVARCIRIHTASLLEPSQAEYTLEEVVADLAEFKNQVHDLQNDNIECLECIGSVKREIAEHREEFRSNQSKDALFRLAASLDQLGARVDQRIGEATSVLQEGSYEVSSLVEASREYLQETLEDLLRRVTRISEDTEAYASGSHAHGAYEDEHVHDQHEHEESPGALRLSLPPVNTVEMGHEPEHGVELTLQHEPDPAPEEAVEPPGLGFLDSIEDSQNSSMPEPDYREAKESDPMGGPPSALPTPPRQMQDHTDPPFSRPA